MGWVCFLSPNHERQSTVQGSTDVTSGIALSFLILDWNPDDSGAVFPLQRLCDAIAIIFRLKCRDILMSMLYIAFMTSVVVNNAHNCSLLFRI